MAKGKKKNKKRSGKSERSGGTSDAPAANEDHANDATSSAASEVPADTSEAATEREISEDAAASAADRAVDDDTKTSDNPLDPYAREPDGGKGALVFLAIVATLLALAVAVGFMQEM